MFRKDELVGAGREPTGGDGLGLAPVDTGVRASLLLLCPRSDLEAEPPALGEGLGEAVRANDDG